MIDKNIKAKLVYDQNELLVPIEMGSPSSDQLQGTPAERLSELCCRVCYDSLGKGRSSDKMHEHLLDVGHWSVYEHFHWTVTVPGYGTLLLAALLNRPGLRTVYEEAEEGREGCLRVTLNLRHLLDWHRWSDLSYMSKRTRDVADRLFTSILAASRHLAPAVFQRLVPACVNKMPVHVVSPIFPCEKFVTCFLSGGRGMSHEQVRHRFAMSQRSTRYVDENESPIVEHPLISAFLNDHKALVHVEEDFAGQAKQQLKTQRDAAVASAAGVYVELIKHLQPWLIAKGVDKFTARKQARGAARNYLGNGLLTEMMFTANLDMWDAMIRLRLNAAADAEIRVVYSHILNSLRGSQHWKHFEKFGLAPSPDGLGEVAVEQSS